MRYLYALLLVSLLAIAGCLSSPAAPPTAGDTASSPSQPPQASPGPSGEANTVGALLATGSPVVCHVTEVVKDASGNELGRLEVDYYMSYGNGIRKEAVKVRVSEGQFQATPMGGDGSYIVITDTNTGKWEFYVKANGQFNGCDWIKMIDAAPEGSKMVEEPEKDYQLGEVEVSVVDMGDRKIEYRYTCEAYNGPDPFVAEGKVCDFTTMTYPGPYGSYP